MDKPPTSERFAGSPGNGEPVFLVIGKLRRPHGVRGEILMDIITDFPERIKAGTRVFVGPQHQEQIIRSARGNAGTLLVTFETFNNAEEVGVLRNQYLYVRAEDRPPLPPGEYYHHQLIGLPVLTDEGQALGVLSEILENAANDVYVVRPKHGADILLPAIDSVILDIDLQQGEMRVHLLPGLLPDENSLSENSLGENALGEGARGVKRA
jgi:16S rRNA processing protein RimM